MRTLIAKPSPIELALQKSSQQRKEKFIEIDDPAARTANLEITASQFRTETSALKSSNEREAEDSQQKRNLTNFLLLQHASGQKSTSGGGLYRAPPATKAQSRPIQEEIIVKPLLMTTNSSNQRLLRLADKVHTEFLKVPPPQ